MNSVLDGSRQLKSAEDQSWEEHKKDECSKVVYTAFSMWQGHRQCVHVCVCVHTFCSFGCCRNVLLTVSAWLSACFSCTAAVNLERSRPWNHRSTSEHGRRGGFGRTPHVWNRWVIRWLLRVESVHRWPARWWSDLLQPSVLLVKPKVPRARWIWTGDRCSRMAWCRKVQLCLPDRRCSSDGQHHRIGSVANVFVF